MLLFRPFAPRLRCFRTLRCAALERNGEMLRYQNLADVTPISFQHSARASIVTRHRALRSGRARTVYEVEVQGLRLHNLSQSARSFVAKLTFFWTLRATGFRRIETDKPHIRLVVIYADRISIDDVDLFFGNFRRMTYAGETEQEAKSHECCSNHD